MIGSTVMAGRLLDLSYGNGRGASMPASVTVRLYAGDPLAGGVELTDTDSPGYAELVVTNNSTNFPNAASGAKTTPYFTVCTATDVWDAAPTHAALCDDTTLLDVVALADSSIPTSGGAVTVSFVLFYNEVSD